MFGLKNKINPDQILKMLQTFGIDVYGMADKYLPQVLQAALKLEHQAGQKLMGTLTIDGTGSFFVVAVYKVDEKNNAELFLEFPLDDIKKIIDQIKNAIAAPDDVQQNSFQPIATIELPETGKTYSVGDYPELDRQRAINAEQPTFDPTTELRLDTPSFPPTGAQAE